MTLKIIYYILSYYNMVHYYTASTVLYGLYGTDYTVRTVWYGLYCTDCTVRTVPYGLYGTDCTVWTVLYGLYRTDYTIPNEPKMTVRFPFFHSHPNSSAAAAVFIIFAVFNFDEELKVDCCFFCMWPIGMFIQRSIHCIHLALSVLGKKFREF